VNTNLVTDISDWMWLTSNWGCADLVDNDTFKTWDFREGDGCTVP
jgi:hypothetical protein